MNTPSQKTIKQLFALSRNRCAFPKCHLPIVEAGSNVVVGEICHIKARSPQGPRYDSSQTHDERHGFDNLVLMCSIHAKVIDEDENSYTVERLHEIKQGHEAGASAEDHRLAEEVNRLLDERIRLILAHEEERAQKDTQETSGPFALANKLANQRRYKERRAKWFASHEALEATIDAVNEIFQGVRDKYNEERDDLQTLEIKLHAEHKVVVVGTRRLGSQIVLEGWDRNDHYTIPNDFRLEMMLFRKRPYPGSSEHFTTDPIERMTLKPDVDTDMNVVWRDNEKNQHSPNEIIESVFSQLLQQIQKGREPSETVPGGRYMVNNRMVNAWGVPIGDDPDLDDFY